MILCLFLIAIKMLDRPEPGLNFFPNSRRMTNDQRREALKFSAYNVLFDFGIRVDWISGHSRFKTVRVPEDLAMIEPYVAIMAKIEKLGGTILKAETNPFGDRMVVEVGLGNESLFQLTLIKDSNLRRTKGRIAIVIDDFGYSFGSRVEGFLALNQEITFSVLPGLDFSEKIALAAVDRDREVMIHLPMEPKNGKFNHNDYDYALLTGMNETEIRKRVRTAISSVSFAKGLNNHMGSMATENDELLSILMDEIKKANLFFLDSMTTPNSKGFSWAQKLKVPCALNNTFLDAIEEEPFIRQQVNLLAEIAARTGEAIGIGHPHELTLKILQEELPKLERRGFQFVSVSEIVE